MDIKVYPNLLDEKLHQYVVEKTLKGQTWKFDGFSHEDGFTFWYMELMDDNFFTETFLQKIQERTNRKFIINRVYANGQTYGLSGSFHQDDYDKQFKTFLYYVNPWWAYGWGGNTVFEQQNQIHNQPFIPNLGILFDSTLNHVGLEPTRHCKELRVTVAFKLKEIGVM